MPGISLLTSWGLQTNLKLEDTTARSVLERFPYLSVKFHGFWHKTLWIVVLYPNSWKLFPWLYFHVFPWIASKKAFATSPIFRCTHAAMVITAQCHSCAASKLDPGRPTALIWCWSGSKNMQPFCWKTAAAYGNFRCMKKKTWPSDSR